jgi:hypothetical protein
LSRGGPTFAAFVALYQARPGEGRNETMEAMLMNTPPPTLQKYGTITLAEWNRLLTLTANRRSNSASSTSRIGWRRWEVAALFTTISKPP